MRLVHAADLHLDSPLRGLSRLGDDNLAMIMRSATRRALENLVDLVLRVGAPVLLLAGDIYDGDWHDYSTGRFFTEQLERLCDEGVRVFLVAGNHDADSQITRTLRTPKGVEVMETGKPQCWRDDDLGIAVHGQGYATRAVQQNLAAAFPPRTDGLVNIGLLHANVDGAEGHGTYAPCQLRDLTSLGYDYFALGHVHRRSVLANGENTVAYCGNLQGRHIRETGPKGALVVDVEPGGGAKVEFEALDVARWATVSVPVDGCVSYDDALERADKELRRTVEDAEGRPVAARVEFSGHSTAAAALTDAQGLREEVDRIAVRAGAAVERVRVDVRPPATMDAPDELVAGVIAAAAELAGDPDRISEALRGLNREVGGVLQRAGLLDLNEGATRAMLARRAADALHAVLAGQVD